MFIIFHFHPQGTFNNLLARQNVSQCQPCLAGMFCETPGLSEPTGDCLEGFLCLSGAALPGPDDGVNGPCPVGHYCENGELIKNPS